MGLQLSLDQKSGSEPGSSELLPQEGRAEGPREMPGARVGTISWAVSSRV